jgi:N-methylhydantoinase A
MRYRGQAFELTVSLSDGIRPDALRRDFERLYETHYGFRPEGRAIDIIAVRVVVRGRVPALRFTHIDKQAGRVENASKGDRPVYFSGQWHGNCPVYDRARLGAGAVLAGPAVIEEYGSTTALPPGWRAEVDAWGHLIITLESGGTK